jgi:hypothetical protein
MAKSYVSKKERVFALFEQKTEPCFLFKWLVSPQSLDGVSSLYKNLFIFTFGFSVFLFRGIILLE